MITFKTVFSVQVSGVRKMFQSWALVVRRFYNPLFRVPGTCCYEVPSCNVCSVASFGTFSGLFFQIPLSRCITT